MFIKRINPNSIISQKETALITAAKAGVSIGILIENGANLSLKDANGNTAFMIIEKRRLQKAIQVAEAILNIQNKTKRIKMKN